MKATELLLLGLVGWTGIGVLGVGVSMWRGQRERVGRGVGWLVGVWLLYLCVLVAVSLGQTQRVVAVGEPQCFDEMCFTVAGVEELPGFLIRDGRASGCLGWEWRFGRGRDHGRGVVWRGWLEFGRRISACWWRFR